MTVGLAARFIAYDEQIFRYQQYGGVSRYFCELAARVGRAPGYRSVVLAGLHFNDHLAKSDVSQSARYLSIRLPRAASVCRLANRWFPPSMPPGQRASLLHQTYYEPARRPPNTPLVVSVFDMIHELFADTFSADDTTSALKRRAVKDADHVICISQSTADDLERIFGVSRTKLSVTHLGYSSVFTACPQRQEHSPHPRPYLLYVGHRHGYKNFRGALCAYASSTVLRDLDFVAFGGTPFTTAELQQIESLRLRHGSVQRLAGSDEMLARVYRHACAFVYPSMYEGFGIPPLEAMASGCPVVCSNVSSIPEVVGGAARTFSPTDIDAIRCALEAVCASDVERRRLTALGKERAALFSWDRCADETTDVYGKCLGLSPASISAGQRA
jgi:glycosyltransferase involved in cell wall biosynthesis